MRKNPRRLEPDWFRQILLSTGRNFIFQLYCHGSQCTLIQSDQRKRISGTSLLYQTEGKHDKGQYTKQYQYRDTGKGIQPTQITERIIPAASATAAKGTMDAGNRYSSAEYRIHRIFLLSEREKEATAAGKPVIVQRSRSKWTTGERNPVKE